MTKSHLLPVALLAAALVAATSSPARAEGMETADVQIRIKAGPGGAANETLERSEIFRILQGGSSSSDVVLCEHLWRVAGSLADRGWTPPKVTMRLVVREQDARD